MKYLIIPPEGGESPEDFVLYDTAQEALDALAREYITIAEADDYTIVAISVEYHVRVDINPQVAIEGEGFRVLDSDGTRVCENVSGTAAKATAHLRNSHGSDIYIHDIPGYSVESIDGNSAPLAYKLSVVGTRIFGGLGEKIMTKPPLFRAKEEAEPNEILLGKENDDELE